MANCLMVQGTHSGAGKTLLVAALCRILRRDGVRVAPFKAQNMALNAYITHDGLEMGRAQAVQAQAAGIRPDVRMNPILLKPDGAMGSQVVLNGRAIGHTKAQDYKQWRAGLAAHVMQAYRALEADFDVVILEGAGGPAELNLKRDDIANMGMAKRANAPVVLVGDIDRGGVFAALYGTLALLEADERARVKATVINKFRGDLAYFSDGPALLQARTGIPNAGVVPFLEVDIEEEDSVFLPQSAAPAAVDIAVVRLPHLSNFTDFHVFGRLADVSLRYVADPCALGKPDVLILPGTKNTVEDMGWLCQTRWNHALRAWAAADKPLLGICGGYQMLGQTLTDEAGQTCDGLGLLRAHTRFLPEKTTRQVAGRFSGDLPAWMAGLSNHPLEGYELHTGQTAADGVPLVLLETHADGCSAGSVCGCYIHGLFDAPGAAHALVDGLRARKGLSGGPQGPDGETYREAQFDLLADGVRRALDMDLIYRIIEQGV